MIDNKNGFSENNTQSSAANAKKFLCVALAFIVAFVGIVCFSVQKRNKNDNKSTTAEASKVAADPGTSSVGTGSSVTVGGTVSATQDTTASTTKAAVTAAAPGTIDEPVVITIDENNWQLTLVNSGYLIPSDYSPDLVYVCGSGEQLDSKVAEHYERMYDAAAAEGVYLTPCSGYRSYETQERNYNNKVAFYEAQGYSTEEAEVKAATIIMPPGSSEHNLGYAMDIVCVDEWFEDTDEFKWLQENAADYGFIMRYPKEKQDITKVIYEPWHWRYVGVDVAREMKASGQVLEEYLGVA